VNLGLERLKPSPSGVGLYIMKGYSTREAAKKLGVTILTLQRHVSAKTVPAPALQRVGGVRARLWSERDIEKARKIPSGIKPGRKKQ